MDACTLIAQQMGELFHCSTIKDYVRIRTPFLYPDGEVVDLFLRPDGAAWTLSDLGESLRWLRMQSVAQKRSKKQSQLVQDVCLTHGVELFRGMLMVRVQRPEELSTVVTRLAQASLRVGDLWFTLRTRIGETIIDDVEEFLQERGIPFERDESAPGRSGRVWRPDFHTRHPRRSAEIFVLSTGSRAAARGIAEHVVAAWYDLNHLKIGPTGLRFVSLFDDTVDVWTPEDIKLVSDLSDVAYWSRSDHFANLISN